MGGVDLDVVESPVKPNDKIYRKESHSIPAFSMINVTLEIPSAPQSTTRLVEPSPKVMADKGLSFGRLYLSECSAKDVNVQFVNFFKSKAMDPKRNCTRNGNDGFNRLY